MFGIKLVTKKGFEKIKQDAQNKSLADLVELLLKKDRIFVEPLTLIGDYQTIRDCVFLSGGIVVKNK